MAARQSLLNRLFRRYVHSLLRRPLRVLGVVGVMTALLATGALRLRVHFDPDANFPPRHPYVQIDHKVRRLFGGWNYVLIVVAPREGTIWNPEVLSVVQDITQDLRLLPGVRPLAIMSLASPNARRAEVRGGRLEIRYVMRQVPHTRDGLARLRAQVLAEPLLRRALVSADERATAITADFDDSVSAAQITAALRRVVARYRDRGVERYVTGGPILIDTYNRYIFRVWQRFALAFGVIAGLLLLNFGTLQGMVIPLLSGGLSTLWALGIVGFVGIAVDQFNSMTPILVMGVTAGHSTQLLKRYYEELRRRRDRHTALAESLLQVAPVMVAGGLTAALGFASLVVFRVPGLRTFGIFTALGIACGVVLELSFTPALRACLRPGRVPEPALDRALRRALGAVARSLAAGCHAPYLGAAALVIALAVAGITRLRTDFSLLAYLPRDTQGQRDFLAARHYFPGTLPLVLLVEGEGPVADDPALLRLAAKIERTLERDPDVVYTASYRDILRRVAEVFGVRPARLDGGPGARALAAQLLFLSYSPQYATLLTRDFATAAIWVFLRETETRRIAAIMDQARQVVAANGQSPRWHVEIGGGVAATRVALTQEITRGKLLNIAVVLGVIGLVAAAMLRSMVGGALVLLPMIVTVLVDLALLGWLGIPLDPVTASIAAMAVGIGADYAIYLLFRLREEASRGGTEEAVLQRALVGTGRGVLCVAMAIAGGYLVLAVSAFRAFTMVGLLVSVTMAFSSVVSLTLLPLFVVRLRPVVVYAGGPRPPFPGPPEIHPLPRGIVSDVNGPVQDKNS